MKAFAAVVLVCFAFTLNCLGQKMEIRNYSIFVDDTLYASIEPSQNPDLETFSFGKNTDKYLRKLPSFKLLNHKGATLAFILPQWFKGKKNNHPYYIRFHFLNGGGTTLKYSPIEDIRKTILEDLIKFEIVSNGRIDKPAVRRILIHYNQTKEEIKYPQFKFTTLNCTEKTVELNNNFMGKFEIVSFLNDTLVKEVDFFDEFNIYKGRVTFIQEYNDEFSTQMEYNFTNDKQEKITLNSFYSYEWIYQNIDCNFAKSILYQLSNLSILLQKEYLI